MLTRIFAIIVSLILAGSVTLVLKKSFEIFTTQIKTKI